MFGRHHHGPEHDNLVLDDHGRYDYNIIEKTPVPSSSSSSSESEESKVPETKEAPIIDPNAYQKRNENLNKLLYKDDENSSQTRDKNNNEKKYDKTINDFENPIDWALGGNKMFPHSQESDKKKKESKDKNDISDDKLASQAANFVLGRLAGTAIGVALISTGILSWLGIAILIFANTPKSVKDSIKDKLDSTWIGGGIFHFENIKNPTDLLEDYADKTEERKKTRYEIYKSSKEILEKMKQENEIEAQKNSVKENNKISNFNGLKNVSPNEKQKTETHTEKVKKSEGAKLQQTNTMS